MGKSDYYRKRQHIVDCYGQRHRVIEQGGTLLYPDHPGISARLLSVEFELSPMCGCGRVAHSTTKLLYSDSKTEIDSFNHVAHTRMEERRRRKREKSLAEIREELITEKTIKALSRVLRPNNFRIRIVECKKDVSERVVLENRLSFINVTIYSRFKSLASVLVKGLCTPICTRRPLLLRSYLDSLDREFIPREAFVTSIESYENESVIVRAAFGPIPPFFYSGGLHTDLMVWISQRARLEKIRGEWHVNEWINS